jgi:predicted O-methyltransferase YrrM
MLLLSERTRNVLREISHDVSFPGATDPSALSFLAVYARVQQPARVLELGTYIGFSTLVLADVLAGNARPGRLVTVDPVAESRAKAVANIRQAGLDSTVTSVGGRSIDAEVVTVLQERGPFDMIYVDSSHSYRETLQELDMLWDHTSIAGDGTCVWLHDAGEAAARYDPQGEGGVRRALDEWMDRRSGTYQLVILEPPVWPNPTGLGVMRRARHRQVA